MADRHRVDELQYIADVLAGVSMSAPSVLLTAFEPFDGEDINPSLEIALRLEASVIVGHRVAVQVLPVAFAHTASALRDVMHREQPDLVIALGQAGGCSALSLERVAINLIDARIADNAGAQPIDTPVVSGGPAAYFSTLPIKAMGRALYENGIPAQLSFSAGSFVCNQVFYLLMHEVATQRLTARAGFMHVPYLPIQAAAQEGAPSMALETMIAGVRCAIACAIEVREDIRVAAGTTH
jgi:pyroglutamyl-peptidase